MNFAETLEKLEASKEFRNFKKKNTDAYLCAGFFVIDFEAGKDTQQMDFQCDEQIAAFSVSDRIEMKMEETIDKKKVPEIKKEIKIDLDEMQKIAGKEIEKSKISTKLNKMIAILQMNNEKQIWNITCIFASLAMLRVHIDAFSGDVLRADKSSLFDFVQKGGKNS
ncbi:MAG: hypothetical protein V1886_00955 [archaeon]